MMKTLVHTILLVMCLTILVGAHNPQAGEHPVWPPPPALARVEYLGEISCARLKMKTNLLGKFSRLIGGRTPSDEISLPFDILVSGESIFLTCQNILALVEVKPADGTYRLHTNNEHPFSYPIGLCAAGQSIFISDSENGIIYRYTEGRVEPLITSGLQRPTGLAALEDAGRLYVVDTGDHTVKIFDFEGNLINTIGGESSADVHFHFPTFSSRMDGQTILINDALNYNIKRLDGDGRLLSAFGREGDGPGTFARPKGIAADDDGHIYVVDNLFDNIQVFDTAGQLLLVIGTTGQEPGQFWSPGGIDIANDTIYVADTFNNRIQILRYLGDGR